MGLALLDHLVVGRESLYSFREQGEIVLLAREYDAMNLEETAP